MNTASFSITRATFSDIPFLAGISSNAFTTDRHTQLKFLDKPGAHFDDITQALSLWLQPHNNWEVLKATDDATGQIIGWVSWGYYGGAKAIKAPSKTELAEGEEDRLVDGPSEKATRGEAPQSMARRFRAENDGMSSQEKSSEMTPLQKLESITNEDMERWQRILMPNGTDGIVIGAVVVSPNHPVAWGRACPYTLGDCPSGPCWLSMLGARS